MDDTRQRNSRLLFSGIAGLVVILAALHFMTGSSNMLSGTATGHSVLEGEAAPDADKVAFALTDRHKFDLLLSTLKLKQLDTGQKLDYAEKITKIDALVEESGNADILGAWQGLTACLTASACGDEWYAFLKEVVRAAPPEPSFWKKKDDSLEKLFSNVLELKIAAEKNNIVTRSKLVRETNTQILSEMSMERWDVWDKLVECNFQCDEYDKLLILITESYFAR